MNNRPAGVVFMGTSDYALPSLQKLHDAGYDIRLVVTQPDRPRGRRRKPAAPPVKILADQLGLDVFQPDIIRRRDCFKILESKQPDVMITASYGQILRRRHLEIPRHGILNVHASLLPEFRGAAPVQFAILEGRSVTGVTIMKTELGIDTGPILSRSEMPIADDDTAGSLEHKLADLGGRLLVDTLPEFLAGRIQPVQQDHTRASYARRITVDDGRIDWSRPAKQIALQVRAMNPWPCAFTICHGQRLKIYRARPSESVCADPRVIPGTICDVVNGKGIHIQTGDGILLVESLQPACRRRMPGDALIRGRFAELGFVLGAAPESEPLPCRE